MGKRPRCSIDGGGLALSPVDFWNVRPRQRLHKERASDPVFLPLWKGRNKPDSLGLCLARHAEGRSLSVVLGFVDPRR
jgi:hypothetical protein